MDGVPQMFALLNVLENRKTPSLLNLQVICRYLDLFTKELRNRFVSDTLL